MKRCKHGINMAYAACCNSSGRSSVNRSTSGSPHHTISQSHTHQYPKRHRKLRGSRLWKMNVRLEHLAACRLQQKFAVNVQPRNMRPGELLLLQVTRGTCSDPHRRITGAPVFERCRLDLRGESRALWGTDFRYILDASGFVATRPFSLEDLPGLVGTYVRQGMMNYQAILPEDEERVCRAAGLDL